MTRSLRSLAFILAYPFLAIAALAGAAVEACFRVQPVDFLLAEEICAVSARRQSKIGSLIASKITFVTAGARGIAATFAVQWRSPERLSSATA